MLDLWSRVLLRLMSSHKAHETYEAALFPAPKTNHQNRTEESSCNRKLQLTSTAHESQVYL
jgi:hypothetical protein